MSGLAAALARLDRRIESALALVPVVYGSESVHDPFRGMHISREDVDAMLRNRPGTPLFFDAQAASNQQDFPRLAWLAREYSLSSFDLDVLILALAPEVDSRYGRLYAYLQDDVARRSPSLEMALNLLCGTFEEKISRRAHFASHAPLIVNDILHVSDDPAQPDAPALSQNLKLDSQIVQHLLGVEGLDARLAGFCELVAPSAGDFADFNLRTTQSARNIQGKSAAKLSPLEALPFAKDFKQAMLSLLAGSLTLGQPLRVYFQGVPGSGRRRLVEALACESGRALLAADMRLMAQSWNHPGSRSETSGFEPSLRLLMRQARLQDAILYLDGLDELFESDGQALLRVFENNLSSSRCPVIFMSGKPAWRSMGTPGSVVQVPFHMPVAHERQAWWNASVSSASIDVDPAGLEALAVRFKLTPGQINAAVDQALGRARYRDSIPDLPALFAAARAQTSDELSLLAQKIEPRYNWDDLVLPSDSLAQLRELCQWVVKRATVLDGWGFERKLSLGKGATALFAGTSGTGKTMAAEVIANQLGLDLYRVNLSTVVSKYIGETEKNLERIFNAAENANAILFFDEADALFGKRSEVKESHDRYANIEISYLLQRMEQYSGVAILCSNLRHNLDEAFTRRLAFIVLFPFPDEDHRQRIWQGVFPGEMPVDEALDLSFMARQFKLSGGSIKNIALSAAYLASANGGVVDMKHLLHATRREYQKLGKTLSDEELYGGGVER